MARFSSLPPPPTGQTIADLDIKRDKDQKVTDVIPRTNWTWQDFFQRLWEKLATLTVLPTLGSSNQLLGVNSAGTDIEYKTLGVQGVAGTLPATNGGTGFSSYAVGDILYANTTTTLARRADVADGQVFASQGVGVTPIYRTLASLGFAIDYPSLIAAPPVASGTDAIAIGHGALASGSPSIAIGLNAQATGTNAKAIGQNAVASNTAAIALGFGATASGLNSLAKGVSATASGSNSVAIGQSAQATFANALALGQSASATGTNAAAIGLSASASATNALAVGQNAVASAAETVAIGHAASCTFSNSIAIGPSAGCGASNTVVIGNAVNNGNASISISASPTPILLSNAQNAVHIGTYRNGGQPFGANGAVNNFVSLGTGSNTDFAGECSWSQGNFVAGTSGTAKVGMFPMRAQTTNATLTPLGCATSANPTGVNPGGQIVLVDNSSWDFDINIIARRTDAHSTNASWNFRFSAKRDTGVGSVAFVGSTVKTILTKDAGAATWDVGAAVDTGTGAVYPTVTGEAGKTIRWVGNVRMTKIMES